MSSATGSRRTPRPVWTGLALIATTALAACGGGTPQDTSSSQSPEPSRSPAYTSPSPAPSASRPAREVTLPVYYVGDQPAGPRLFREFRRLRASGPMGRFTAAVNAALAGRSLDPDYRTDWPAGTAVDSVDRSSGTTTLAVDLTNGSVDLTARPEGLDAPQARLAIQQLVYTVQAVAQQRASVALSVEGRPVDRVLGVRVPTTIDAGDPMQVQGSVWVVDPQDGATVGPTFAVDGRGAFFEATVSWQLLSGGKVVKQGVTSARECCTLSPYGFQVRDVPAGDYTLRVFDADVSGGEGYGEAADTKRLTVG